MSAIPPVVERFLRYVQIDTQSDPLSDTVPSTTKQLDLSRLLTSELEQLGLPEVHMDVKGYVFASLPAISPSSAHYSGPVVGLLAHIDTAPDAPGNDVKPVIHPDYQGEIITFPGNSDIVLDPEDHPALKQCIGHDIITSDGTTLLGSDDKAGVAILMQLAADWINDHHTPRPNIRLCFTIDEEIGKGIDSLDLDVLGVDVAYTIDGNGINTLAAETFNAAEANLSVKGVMVHPGYAYGKMVNAIRILADLVGQLPAHESPEKTRDDQGYFHPLDFTAHDAAHATCRIILRDFDEQGLAERKQYIQKIVEEAGARYPRATIELKIIDQYKNMRSYIEEVDPRVMTVAQEAAAAMGIEMQFERIRGGTDGARLSEAGIPTPNVFNGGQAYHSLFEWNTVQNLEHSLHYVKQLMQTWGKTGSR